MLAGGAGRGTSVLCAKSLKESLWPGPGAPNKDSGREPVLWTWCIQIHSWLGALGITQPVVTGQRVHASAHTSLMEKLAYLS